jgi:NAD(P)H-hydrate repair Nnr-like enzyme with NAD(P)H-hydrate epimerase domain
VLALLLGATLGACSLGYHLSKHQVERTASRALKNATGRTSGSIDCPRGLDVTKGNSERCVLTASSFKAGMTVTLDSVSGRHYHMHVQVDNRPLGQ